MKITCPGFTLTAQPASGKRAEDSPGGPADEIGIRFFGQGELNGQTHQITWEWPVKRGKLYPVYLKLENVPPWSFPGWSGLYWLRQFEMIEGSFGHDLYVGYLSWKKTDVAGVGIVMGTPQPSADATLGISISGKHFFKIMYAFKKRLLRMMPSAKGLVTLSSASWHGGAKKLPEPWFQLLQRI